MHGFLSISEYIKFKIALFIMGRKWFANIILVETFHAFNEGFEYGKQVSATTPNPCDGTGLIVCDTPNFCDTYICYKSCPFYDQRTGPF